MEVREIEFAWIDGLRFLKASSSNREGIFLGLLGAGRTGPKEDCERGQGKKDGANKKAKKVQKQGKAVHGAAFINVPTDPITKRSQF
jgi:hypothetical protein